MARNNEKKINDFATIILENITEGVFTIDQNRHITSFNKAAESIIGIKAKEAVGMPCFDVFHASICEHECALCHTMETGQPIIGKTIYIINSKGEQVPISVSTALLRDESEKIIGGVETFRDLTIVNKLRKELEARYTFADIISKNSEMKRIFSTLPQIAESGSTVLIQGVSGSGKELFARVIHNLSKRKHKKMVTVNCGALPDTLLESELFGYKAGAFTDAKKDKKGRFAEAEGGTIFLDEIGDISAAFQIRLLRVLQEKVYQPLGSNENIRADVRVITATNKDLTELVARGVFRDDLYYRINIMKIVLPPLKKRREDIPLLIKHFISKFNNISGKNIEAVSPQVMEHLMRHHFPGNVRELENIIEHAFVLCRERIIQLEHLPAEITQHEESITEFTNIKSSIEEVQANLILEALERNNWNRLAAAADLGIHKATLFRRIKQYGLKLPDKDGRSLRKK